MGRKAPNITVKSGRPKKNWTLAKVKQTPVNEIVEKLNQQDEIIKEQQALLDESSDTLAKWAKLCDQKNEIIKKQQALLDKSFDTLAKWAKLCKEQQALLDRSSDALAKWAKLCDQKNEIIKKRTEETRKKDENFKIIRAVLETMVRKHQEIDEMLLHDINKMYQNNK